MRFIGSLKNAECTNSLETSAFRRILSEVSDERVLALPLDSALGTESLTAESVSWVSELYTISTGV
jgi:hypothetical protein